LVFEAGFRDNEVDDCALSSSLGLVVRVDEFGLEIELELWIVVDVFSSQFD